MFSYKKTAVVIIIFTLILSVIIMLIAYRNPTNEHKQYILKEYNGSVALFMGENILSVYDEIVLSAFPHSDRQRFIKGIPVSSPEEAQTIIEDYDG
ncbi:MAG: hypothetical protein J5659_03160 [Clostridia bacterium]|nr:hypothetical protein [Clostridia bacterium]